MTSRWSDFVHIERTPNGVGRITLDRPKALNALDLGMIRALAEALLAWRDDPAVVAVRFAAPPRTGRSGPFARAGISASSIRPRWRAIRGWRTSLPRSTPSIT